MPGIDLQSKVAIVTGSGRGIGLATTKKLLEAGCSVYANIRSLGSADIEQVRELQDRYADLIQIEEGSAADPQTASRIMKSVFQKHRRLDILVNNAGILRSNMLGMIPDDEMESVIANNILSVLHFTQSAARLMVRGESGSIINLSSFVGRFGGAGQVVYSASKAAIIGATLASAKELAPKAIRVNAIAPGLIETQMTESLIKAAGAHIGMGRYGTVDEVADVALFLASDLSRYVTGQVIGVDGGLIA